MHVFWIERHIEPVGAVPLHQEPVTLYKDELRGRSSNDHLSVRIRQHDFDPVNMDDLFLQEIDWIRPVDDDSGRLRAGYFSRGAHVAFHIFGKDPEVLLHIILGNTEGNI